MSVDATNYLISGLGITGDWGVYYNFENYDGGFINSEGYSQIVHSGEIIGNSSSFENNSPGIFFGTAIPRIPQPSPHPSGIPR